LSADQVVWACRPDHDPCPVSGSAFRFFPLWHVLSSSCSSESQSSRTPCLFILLGARPLSLVVHSCQPPNTAESKQHPINIGARALNANKQITPDSLYSDATTDSYWGSWRSDGPAMAGLGFFSGVMLPGDSLLVLRPGGARSAFRATREQIKGYGEYQLEINTIKRRLAGARSKHTQKILSINSIPASQAAIPRALSKTRQLSRLSRQS